VLKGHKAGEIACQLGITSTRQGPPQARLREARHYVARSAPFTARSGRPGHYVGRKRLVILKRAAHRGRHRRSPTDPSSHGRHHRSGLRLLIRRIGDADSCRWSSSPARPDPARPSTLKMLHFVDNERPIAIQIYGSDPARMGEAAQVVEAMGADVCDINMGCPPTRCSRVVPERADGRSTPGRSDRTAVRTRIRTPLTVKFRLGMTDASKTFLELGRSAKRREPTASRSTPEPPSNSSAGTPTGTPSHNSNGRSAYR